MCVLSVCAYARLCPRCTLAQTVRFTPLFGLFLKVLLCCALFSRAGYLGDPLGGWKSTLCVTSVCDPPWESSGSWVCTESIEVLPSSGSEVAAGVLHMSQALPLFSLAYCLFGVLSGATGEHLCF